MKTKVLIPIFLTFLFVSFSAFAGDVLTLMNENSFEGKIIKIKDCEVIFKANHQRFTIPATDIFCLKFEDSNNKIYLDYLQLDDADKCMRGQSDAEMYHGKAFGHIALGVLFGPFALLGAAAGSPSPQNGANTYMMSKNKELFSDPAYLMCYRKKARSRNVTNTLIGWGSWILFVLVVSSASTGGY